VIRTSKRPAKYTYLICPCVCSAVCKLGSIKRLYEKGRDKVIENNGERYNSKKDMKRYEKE